jgi:hypothetical protein
VLGQGGFYRGRGGSKRRGGGRGGGGSLVGSGRGSRWSGGEGMRPAELLLVLAGLKGPLSESEHKYAARPAYFICTEGIQPRE